MAYRNLHLFLTTFYVVLMSWVWLAPLELLTDTKDAWLFLCFVALFGVSRWFAFFPWVPALLTGIGFVCVFYFYYFQVWDFWSLDWLKVWGAELVASLPYLLEWDWLSMAPLARTFYFFLWLWLFCACLWHYVYRKGRAFWFVVISAMYFSVLDTFTPYDASGAITLTIIAGLLFLLWLRWYHAVPRASSPVHVQWLAGGLALIMLVTSAAYAAPKPGPAWPDPIPWFIHRGASGDGDAIVQKVGYSSDDSRLGGAFVEENGVVLEVRTTALAYWRGESKDVYTGKGWFSSAVDRRADRLLAVGEAVPDDYPRLFDDSAMEFVPVRQQVRLVDETALGGRRRYPLFHQGMVTLVHDADVRMVSWSQDAHGIYTLNRPLTSVQLEAVLPVIDEGLLRQTGQDYPLEILRRYLQLPSIPERVRQLAETLTADADNPYDKAKAIEAYLQSDEFTYDTRNVTVPDEDEDFVDKFLFESKRGYCDYFSTAMVVMLRSIGIPARWVKGFTSGELAQKTGTGAGEEWLEPDQPYYEGTVRHRHAHSWVEVYFAGIGWLPFEPTKGFSLPQTMTAADDLAMDEDSATSETEETTEEQKSGEDGAAPEESGWTTFFLPWAMGTDKHGLFTGLGVGLGMLMLIGWLFRDGLWFQWQLRRRKQAVTAEVFVQAFRRLIKSLERHRSRQPSETLREYLRRIGLDEALSAQADLYETWRFGRGEGDDFTSGPASQDWNEQLRRLYDVYRQIQSIRFPFGRPKRKNFRTFNR